MITLDSVSKSYAKGQPAVNNVSLHIEKGEFVFIVGNSGSGKSTLIKLLLKELEPTSGTIKVNGQILNKMKRWRVPKYRRGVGVVFQDFRLLKDRNVYENVAFAQRVIEKPNRVIKKRVPEVLTLVGLAEKYKSFPKELSGGEQQRVAVARAIVNRPDILLADEPTGNLDTKTTKEVMELMVRLCRKNNQTLVLVTHDRELALYADRIITLIDGKVVDDRENRSIAEISEEPSASSETAALPENTSASKALQSSQDDEMAQVVNALLPDDLQEQPKQLGEVVDEKPEEMEEKQEITDQEREDEEKQ